MDKSQRWILCVEDDPDTQEMLRIMLQEHGYAFKAVDNCADALHLIRHNDIDAVLLDNVLIDGTGIDLCMKIRQFNSRLPIIFLSGSVHENGREAAIRAGANAFLSKPFELGNLYDTLDQLVYL